MLEETMKEQHTTTIGRRPVLKGAGMALAGLGGLTGSAVAKKGGKEGENGKGLRPLEETSSSTGSFVSRGVFTTFDYPYISEGALTNGQVFDTTSADITPNGQTIHYQLQFDLNVKPYILRHEGEGRYTSRGAVVNFELPSQNPFGLPAGKYRATVRDDVNLYEMGGAFDWSVTRIDFFVRHNMSYAGSSLVVVWDEDGPNNDDDEDRNPASDHFPDYSDDNGALGDVYTDIDASAKALMGAGVSNPGGQ